MRVLATFLAALPLSVFALPVEDPVARNLGLPKLNLPNLHNLPTLPNLPGHGYPGGGGGGYPGGGNGGGGGYPGNGGGYPTPTPTTTASFPPGYPTPTPTTTPVYSLPPSNPYPTANAGTCVGLPHLMSCQMANGNAWFCAECRRQGDACSVAFGNVLSGQPICRVL